WLLVLGWLAAVAVSVGFLTHAEQGGRQPDGDSKTLYLVEMVRPGGRDHEADRLIRATLRRDGKFVTETVLTTKAGFCGDPRLAPMAAGGKPRRQFGGATDAAGRRIFRDQPHGHLLGAEKGEVAYRLYDPSSDLKVIFAPGRAEQFGVFAFNLETRTRTR